MDNTARTAARWVENACASTGLFIILGDKLVQWVGHLTGKPVEHGFTLDSFIYAALLIAPFTLGRATAGQVWTKVPDMLVSLVRRRSGQHRTPEDTDGSRD